MATAGTSHPDHAAHSYLRVSLDRSGREKSQTDQDAENEQHRERQGLGRRGEVYRDTGSASRFARKGRGDFDRLIGDLEAGRVFAPDDTLILWESSRGSRRQAEWATLLDLLHDRKIAVYVTSHGRKYDLANPRDRRSLDEDGTDSAYESAKLSQRIKRGAAASAAEGRPHGKVPWGWQRQYDPLTRRLIGQEINESEAQMVRELYDRLERGHALSAIARDFEARGIRTRSGKVWSRPLLRSLALRPAYAGLRVHDPERYDGDKPRNRQTENAKIVPATWPPIVSKERFYAVTRILRDESRKTTRPGSGIHLLSMIGRCDQCGGPITVTYARRKAGQYTCSNGHLRIDKAELDALVAEVLIGWLAQPEVYQGLRDTQDDTELGEVREQLAQARAEHDALADSGISVALAARKEPAILARIAELEAREEVLNTPAELRGLLPPRERLTQWWYSEDTPMSARRRVVRLVLVPGRIGQLRVKPVPAERRGVRVPARERIRFSHL